MTGFTPVETLIVQIVSAAIHAVACAAVLACIAVVCIVAGA